MTFLDRFVQGEFGTEEKKVVMDKTVSVSTDPADEKVKVDHLDSDNELEKDIIKQRKAERDVTGTVALPLFRFEDKQKKEVINVMKQAVEIATEEVKNNVGGPYTSLFGYVKVLPQKDIEFKVDLTISRNKEIFNTSAKEFEIELVTCYFDKKLRIKYNISEDKVVDEKVDVEYANTKRSIRIAIEKLTNVIIDRLKLKSTGTERDISIYYAESSGEEDYGTGYSIFLKYNKLIDYSNYRRGKEGYSLYSFILDEDFLKSLENVQSIEEQLNINPVKSTEAIADGMSENSDEGEDEEDSGEDNSEEIDAGDASSDEGDDAGGDFGDEGGDEEGEEEGDMGGDEGSSDDSSSDSGSSDEKPKTAGKNPFAEINSKEKVSAEFSKLKDQIDKVLIRLNPLKSTVVVKKLVELDSLVEDALRNSFSVPLQDSLIRYTLYLTQFDDLITELFKRSQKSAQ